MVLKHVQKSENPEGWGRLHHETGRTHYFHGRFLSDANTYLAEAVAAYTKALDTLIGFPTHHLAVLQDAIRVYLALGNLAKVKECREQGLAVFRQLFKRRFYHRRPNST